MAVKTCNILLRILPGNINPECVAADWHFILKNPVAEPWTQEDSIRKAAFPKKKKGGEKKKDEREKKLFHLIRDRGEERGIKRITKRPTDWV